MRLLRPLAVSVTVLASTAVVVLVSADRLAHLAPARASAIRASVPEPSATGSIPAPVKPAPVVKPAAPAIPNGFDTERLNALMRGDVILPRR